MTTSNTSNLDTLFNKAYDAPASKRTKYLSSLAAALAHCDNLTINEYTTKVGAHNLLPYAVFKETVKDFQKKTSEQSGKKSKPTDDELAEIWIKRYPETVYGLGEFRRYKDGIYPVINNDQIKREVLDILSKEKSGGIRPSKARLESVLELARIKVSIPDELWDRHVDYLPCRNGTLHIPTRTLEQHNPELFFTSGLDYDYEPYAKCPTFKYVLASTIPDAEPFLQEFVGLALTTDTRFEQAVWLYGPPGSGKSTILTGLQAMLGPRSGELGLADIQRNRFSLTTLPGKTLMTSFEQPANKELATDVLNRIISGEPITVDRKFRDPISIIPRAKLIWAMNELPLIKSANNGLLRRVKVIKFPPLREDKIDINLKEKVKNEGPGILNWALDGLHRLRKRGYFDPPRAVLDATNNFKTNIDIPGIFLNEKCELGPEYSQQASELYESYKAWCSQNGYEPLSITAIAEEWKRLGLEPYLSNGRRRYRGVKLK